MPHLEVPGASIYHESVGNGPMLLCVSGGDGSVDIWRMFAETLKDRFTVVMWDRRGFSRSHLTDSQDYAHRLETDTDDAAALIKHFSPNTPATVIGNSSGAIVSLKLLTRYPDLIRTLISYEPPGAGILPDEKELLAEHEAVYALYRAHGVFPAIGRFMHLTEADQTMVKAFTNPKAPFLAQNTMYWFEREFMAYPFAKFDIQKDFAPRKEKLIVIVGEGTPHTPYQYRANELIGKELGLELKVFPGEHVGHVTHAKAFAERLYEVLKEHDQAFYANM